jgi:hypothetical protein
VAVRAQRVEPRAPQAILGDPTRWDYADSFEIAAAEPRSAEQWARGALEHGPTALRTFVTIGWRYVLRLRLDRTIPSDNVGGWPIVARTPESIVLGVESAILGHARLTFDSSASIARASTNVAFERRGARTIWSVAGLIHRRVLPYLLAHAARVDTSTDGSARG